MANIRIKDQTTVTTLQAGDYVIVDTEASGVGTRKFDLGTRLNAINDSLLQVYVQDTSLIINSDIQNGEDVSY